MKRVTIIIETENEAFGDYPALEVYRILDQIIKEDNLESKSLKDANGNKTGSMYVL